MASQETAAPDASSLSPTKKVAEDKTKIKSAGNFDHTFALSEKGAIGFWRDRSDLAPFITPVEIDPNEFTRGIARTLTLVLRRLLMKKKPQIADSAPVENFAATLATACCIEAYLKLRLLTISEMPCEYTPNRISKPRIHDRLALPMGSAFCIQQLGIVNVADLPKEVIFLPQFTDAGHNTGIPTAFADCWNPTAYAQAVEFARNLGMRFAVIDLDRKDGTAWWLFRQVYEDGLFELQLPIPESNFTKSMVVAHAMFLQGTLADPTHNFVNLEPVGTDNFGVMLRNPHAGINASCYESFTSHHLCSGDRLMFVNLMVWLLFIC